MNLVKLTGSAEVKRINKHQCAELMKNESGYSFYSYLFTIIQSNFYMKFNEFKAEYDKMKHIKMLSFQKDLMKLNDMEVPEELNTDSFLSSNDAFSILAKLTGATPEVRIMKEDIYKLMVKGSNDKTYQILITQIYNSEPDMNLEQFTKEYRNLSLFARAEFDADFKKILEENELMAGGNKINLKYKMRKTKRHKSKRIKSKRRKSKRIKSKRIKSKRNKSKRNRTF